MLSVENYMADVETTIVNINDKDKHIKENFWIMLKIQIIEILKKL